MGGRCWQVQGSANHFHSLAFGDSTGQRHCRVGSPCSSHHRSPSCSPSRSHAFMTADICACDGVVPATARGAYTRTQRGALCNTGSGTGIHTLRNSLNIPTARIHACGGALGHFLTARTNTCGDSEGAWIHAPRSLCHIKITQVHISGGALRNPSIAAGIQTLRQALDVTDSATGIHIFFHGETLHQDGGRWKAELSQLAIILATHL